MGKSARILGALLNLTAEEMNELFKLNGLLEGEPGEYEVTEAGEPYATERDEHRGPGGSSWYNRDWTVRTWDDSVMDALDTSPEMLQEARENVSERRRVRCMATVEEQAEEDSLVEENEESEDYDPAACVEPADVLKGVAIVGAIVGAIIAAPHVKKFYTEKVKPACKKAWSKVTKRPDELREIAEGTDESSEDALNQQENDTEERKDEE